MLAAPVTAILPPLEDSSSFLPCYHARSTLSTQRIRPLRIRKRLKTAATSEKNWRRQVRVKEGDEVNASKIRNSIIVTTLTTVIANIRMVSASFDSQNKQQKSRALTLLHVESQHSEGVPTIAITARNRWIRVFSILILSLLNSLTL